MLTLFVAKILIQREKKTVLEDGREFTVVRPRQYLVEDTTKDFHTELGIIDKKELKAKDGSIVKAKNTGKEFVIFSAGFIDVYKRLKRLPQAIPLKDIGIIIAETGIDKESIVFEAGVGSGLLSCYLAHLCKKVVGYEIKKECIELAKTNLEKLGIKNVVVKEKNVYEGIDEKNIDVVVFDLPEPWKAVPNCVKALKIGGFIVNYSPQVPQVQKFVEAVKEHKELMYLKTVELIERPWKIEGMIARPSTAEISHSGFLSFARKIC